MSNFSAISWQEQVTFQWDDDDGCFVLDKYTLFDIYSASSLKLQPTRRHVTPLGHIFLIPSWPIFTLTTYCYMLSLEAANTSYIKGPSWSYGSWIFIQGSHLGCQTAKYKLYRKLFTLSSLVWISEIFCKIIISENTKTYINLYYLFKNNTDGSVL